MYTLFNVCLVSAYCSPKLVWNLKWIQILCFIVIWGEKVENIKETGYKGLFHSRSVYWKTLVVFRVGEKILLGAHNVTRCEESEGCKKVEIIQVWNHENYSSPRQYYNDISLVRYLSFCFFIICVFVCYFCYLCFCFPVCSALCVGLLVCICLLSV